MTGDTAPSETLNAWSPWMRDTRKRLRRLLAAGDAGRLPPRVQRLLAAHPFLALARDTQAPPPDLSRTWLLSGGRGAGKTRAGAEWVRWAVLQAGYRRVALVGPTFSDVREVMIEGPSGLIPLAAQRADRPLWQPSRQRLEWQNGAVAYGFSAEDPEALRGPQFDLAWCDEAGAWAKGEAVWTNLQLALRLGHKPLSLVTTTPRATPLIRKLMADPLVAQTRTATAENAAHLAPGFVGAMIEAYGCTVIGRQELDGEMIDDPPGALFPRALIEAGRVEAAPLNLEDCILAVDPSVSSKPGADACGIILAGSLEGKAYVLGDASAPGLSPMDWAQRAASLAEIGGASCILAEAN
ncbi:terminase large subunit domain-containing protein [Hyphomonas sp.]|uniref:terminase large subunit domain-containing protein n=1 Tax=Hyphomonas sp. TaxID=87 RepID=UPI00391CD512